MTLYKVQILPSVIRKDLVKLPVKDVARIMDKIKSLGENPRPYWAMKLSCIEEYKGREGTTGNLQDTLYN